MGQGSSEHPPVVEEVSKDLGRCSLQATASSWGSASTARWRWAVDADAWHPAGGASGAEFQFLLGLLPEGREREDVLRLPDFRDRKRSLAGRLLARRACAQALGVEDFSSFALGRTKGGKPFLQAPLPEGLPNFNFNISHDGRWVVLASDPLRLVGVDIAAPQWVRGDREDDSWRVDLQSLMYDSEQRLVDQEETVRGRYSVFQRLWSAKEAVTKAVGCGLDFGLDRVEVELDGGPHLGGLLPDLLSGLGLSTAAPASAPPDGPAAFATAAAAAASQRAAGPRAASASIDMWSRRDWVLTQHCLPDHHWVTVALGPVEEAVDANGQFAATLRLPGVDEEARRRAKSTSQPSSGYEILQVASLVPKALSAKHQALQLEAPW